MMKYEASLVLNQYIQSQQYFPVFAKLGATLPSRVLFFYVWFLRCCKQWLNQLLKVTLVWIPPELLDAEYVCSSAL